ncbi:MAG: hypothetical protein J6B43_05455 [Lachnospiraceae bacterium]|nr:hypothetical protein [Lachnospiraceae bacterium]
MKCIECGKKIDVLDEMCHYCGVMQYDEEPVKLPVLQRRANREKTSGFSDDEILAMGLYPKDEKYKMSLISKIVGR